MLVHTHTHAYTYICVHNHTCTYTNTHAHTITRISTLDEHTRINTPTHTHTQQSTHTYTRIQTSTNIPSNRKQPIHVCTRIPISTLRIRMLPQEYRFKWHHNNVPFSRSSTSTHTNRHPLTHTTTAHTHLSLTQPPHTRPHTHRPSLTRTLPRTHGLYEMYP
eukprot:GHVQ01033844.1.p1 GENE.GHVQ01033844.1~~GHVQ01033844.1.p1  ORF type:complete len:162 (-),score=19.94 GHVQ01033844.1:38-523(-)